MLMILLRFKISGHSMLPTLKPNQEILVSSLPYYFKKPKVGDIIAFQKNGIYIVKRIKALERDKYQIEGDNKSDSKDYGLINKKDIIGKLVYVFS